MDKKLASTRRTVVMTNAIMEQYCVTRDGSQQRGRSTVHGGQSTELFMTMTSSPNGPTNMKTKLQLLRFGLIWASLHFLARVSFYTFMLGAAAYTGFMVIKVFVKNPVEVLGSAA